MLHLISHSHPLLSRGVQLHSCLSTGCCTGAARRGARALGEESTDNSTGCVSRWQRVYVATLELELLNGSPSSKTTCAITERVSRKRGGRGKRTSAMLRPFANEESCRRCCAYHMPYAYASFLPSSRDPCSTDDPSRIKRAGDKSVQRGEGLSEVSVHAVLVPVSLLSGLRGRFRTQT